MGPVSVCSSFVLLLLLLQVDGACRKSGGGGGGGGEAVDSRGSRSGRSVDQGRLPPSVLPVHYDLELQVFPDQDTFQGQVTIWLQCLGRTLNITLHSAELVVQEARLLSRIELGAGDPLPSVHRLRLEAEKQLLIIDLDRELTSGAEYGLFLRFAGNYSTDQSGLFKITYKDASNDSDRWVAVTQFEATEARRVFPCFDEPGMKATFNITLIRPVAMTTLSNTRRLVSIEREPGWIADQYESTVKMSTYLVAFTVCDFAFLEDLHTSNQVVRTWARKNAISHANYTISIAPKILNYFEDFFNISYSLPKLDLIAVPDFQFGGMENWGLIIFQEQSILLDYARSSSNYKQELAQVVSHEISHQWFGNLVTMKWWDELWLKEGFASYMQYLGVDAVEPTWDVMSQFPYSSMYDAMDRDGWNNSHPISVAVKKTDEIGAMYDQISYFKGSSVIRMMDHFLSRDIFQKGIVNYLRALQYSSASQDDLWRHLNEAAKNCTVLNDTDVKTVMDTWTLQAGYPVITVIRDYNIQTANVTQKKFFFNRRIQDEQARWNVPITFTTASHRNFNETLPQKWLMTTDDGITLNQTDGLTSAEDWVIVNVQHTAFYRVNYDTYNWNLLIQQLKADHEKIHVVNRAQILDDILNLARAGYLNYNLALSATRYLVKENDYVPWATAFEALDYIDTMLRFTPAYGYWKSYISKLIEPAYNKIGFFDITSDSHLKRLARSTLVKKACEFELPSCIDSAVSLYKQWIKSKGNALLAGNLMEATVCTAIRHGGALEWEFAWEQYLKTSSNSEKESLLKAMTCTREPWLLLRYLKRSIAGGSVIPFYNARYIITKIAQTNPMGKYIAFNFLRDNWDVYRKMYTLAWTIGDVVRYSTITMNTPEDYIQLKAFIADKSTTLGHAARALNTALEVTSTNIDWMEDNLATVSSWLEKNQ